MLRLSMVMDPHCSLFRRLAGWRTVVVVLNTIDPPDRQSNPR